MTTRPELSTDTYHLELKPGPDPLRRRGINREPIQRLRKLLKIAARECGFRASWGNPERPMIRFEDGPAAEQLLMLRRAPLYLRVVYDCVKQEWNALDQLRDRPEPGEAIFVYRRVGEASWCHLRPGGTFATATYRVVAEQPDAETLRDTAKWRKWCWAQVKAGGDASATR